MDLTLSRTCKDLKLALRFTISFALGLIVGYPISVHLKSQFTKPICIQSTWLFPKWNMLLPSNQEKKEVSQQETIYIGMMSMKNKMDTRVEAAINTWAKHPSVKVEIFANNNGTREKEGRFVESYLKDGIRVIQLAGVTDVAYPPQKKCFSMVKYMHDMYINKFDWFVRLDDDAYLDIEKLRVLLSSINSSKPFYIGNVGKGKDKNDFVPAGENYCMGGPGMIFSKALLQKLAPKLKHCLGHLMTEHEDIELGRCVTIATGEQCTWSWQFGRIFVQKYHEGVMVRNIKEVTQVELDEGVSFHCNKDSEYQYNLHVLKLKRKIADLMTKVTRLEREIQKDSKPGESWLHMATSSAPMHWNAIVASQSYNANEKEAVMDKHVTLSKTLHDAMEKFVQHLYFEPYIGNIHSLTIASSYSFLNPLLSFDIVSWVVGPHGIKQSRMLHQRKSFVKNINFFREPHDINLDAIRKESYKRPLINFIITFKGKNDNFEPFLKNFESICLRTKETVRLIVVHFPINTVSNETNPRQTKQIASNQSDIYNSNQEIKRMELRINDLLNEYPDAMVDFHVVKSGMKFSTSAGHRVGGELVKNENEIIFFSDIDLAFTSSVLDRIRYNTIQGKQVYDPVFFTQYDPGVVYSRRSKPQSHFTLQELDGFWWNSHDGILSIYKSDLQAVLGGSNDVLKDDNLDAILEASKLEVFQSADPSQVHIYHEKYCDPSTTAKLYQGCVLSRASHSGPKTFLYRLYREKDGILVMEES